MKENHKNPFNASGSSPTEPDFVVENHFTLFLLFAYTDSEEANREARTEDNC